MSDVIIPFPTPKAPAAPRVDNAYMAWLRERFPDGDIGHNPPISAFLASPDQRTGWTSHVPEGGDPDALRVDVYLRRRWRLDEEALCIGNVVLAGEHAPREWDDANRAILAGVIADTIRAAGEAGFARVAVMDVAEGVRSVYEGLGYSAVADAAPECLEMIRDVA